MTQLLLFRFLNWFSFGLRYVSWYKCLIVGLVFSHLGFWSGSLFLIAPFSDICLLVPFYTVEHRVVRDECLDSGTLRGDIKIHLSKGHGKRMFSMDLMKNISDSYNEEARTLRNNQKFFFFVVFFFFLISCHCKFH